MTNFLPLYADLISPERLYSAASIAALCAARNRIPESRRGPLTEALFQWAIKQRFPKNGDRIEHGERLWRGSRWLSQSDDLFDSVEASLRRPDPNWTKDDLLAQKALFFFKDIAPILGVKIAFIHKLKTRALKQGQDPWRQYGVRKILERWYVRMDRFAPAFRAAERPWKELPDGLSGNQILDLAGVYRLVEVAKRLPFSLDQLRHRVKIDGPERTGGWKDPVAKQYLVDMERFATFIRDAWKLDPDD